MCPAGTWGNLEGHMIDARSDLTILDTEACLAHLSERSGYVGRLAYLEGVHPVVLPVNYMLDRDRIALRTAEGSKLTAAKRGAAVSFQVDHIQDFLESGWSVLVRGHARLVDADDERARLAAIGLRTWSGDDLKSHWVVIPIEQISGRRISLLTRR